MRMVYIAPVCICLNLLYIIIIISIYYYIISVVIKDPSRDAYFPLQKMMIHHEREASPLWNARSRNAETLLGGWGTYAGGGKRICRELFESVWIIKTTRTFVVFAKIENTHALPPPPSPQTPNLAERTMAGEGQTEHCQANVRVAKHKPSTHDTFSIE